MSRKQLLARARILAEFAHRYTGAKSAHYAARAELAAWHAVRATS